MKNHIAILLSLLLAAFLTGCASTVPNGILITAQRDPAFSPARTNTICMSILNNPSRENTDLGAALMAELVSEHFNIVTNSDADYTLAYLIEDDSTSEIVPRATHPYINPNMAPPPGLHGTLVPLTFENEQPGEPSMQTTIEPAEYVHPDKGIRLYLYTNPKTHAGGLQIAWQGCIEAGETVSPDREPLLIKTLLGYFGQDYTGRIELGQ